MAKRAKVPSDVLRAYLQSLRSKRGAAKVQAQVYDVSRSLVDQGVPPADAWEQAKEMASGVTTTKGTPKGKFAGVDKKQLTKLGKGAVLYYLLSQGMGAFNKNREQAVQRGAMREQAELATPENLYYQAAMPQAQQEEAEARQALMMHLSGGVVGPSIATGERVIGV